MTNFTKKVDTQQSVTRSFVDEIEINSNLQGNKVNIKQNANYKNLIEVEHFTYTSWHSTWLK